MNSPRLNLRSACAAGLWCVSSMMFLSSCATGPDYARPEIDVPAAHRAAAALGADAEGASLNLVPFDRLFADPVLSGYLTEAVTNNYDIQIAAARILQAEASARIARSAFWPSLYAGGDWTSARGSEIGPTLVPPGTDTTVDYASASLAVPAYELDLWGRLRRGSEAARARLLAAEDSAAVVRQSLIAQVVTVYFDLLELDAELNVARDSLSNRTNSLSLASIREQGGVASLQDVRQAEVLVTSAEASLVDILRRLEQKENELSILLGRNPGAIERGPGLWDQQFEGSLLAGLPSELLLMRPDLRAAEQQLVAANADVGQARAAFYPKIQLTGAYGYQSLEFSDLFTSPAEIWQFVPSVSLPMFTGGQLKANLAAAQARFDEAIANYRKLVQGAFREVADALVSVQRSREFYDRQLARTEAHRDSARLANIRYEGGVTSYMEVLYNEQELFTAEFTLAQSRRNELLALVQLYRALGGGWTTSLPAQ